MKYLGPDSVSQLITLIKASLKNFLSKPTTSGTSGQVLKLKADGTTEWGDVEANELPVVDTTDNGKFLRVVDGAWNKATIPQANGEGF